MEQVESSKSFRELQAFLSSCRYLHVVPQIVRDRERARPAGDDPFGGDLLRRIKNMPEKTRRPRLERIQKALSIAVPQFVALNLVDDEMGVPHLQAKFQGWRLNPHTQDEKVFSDGTLRLIGLLWSMSERGGPLLLEEPELSLNEAVIEQIPEMIQNMQRLSRRQVMLTTHSAALLGGGHVGLSEVIVVDTTDNGSTVRQSSSDPRIRAQVEGGMTIAEAVLPWLRPRGAEALSEIAIAS